MRRCRINLPNRCCHLISRVAHRALEFGGLQAANRKGRYDKEKLLWQFTVAIKSDSVGFCWLPAARADSRVFAFSLELDSTASNNVEVAFGCEKLSVL